MAATLTQRAIETAKPDPAKRREMPDGGLPGFYLVVQPSGAKSWAVRYRFAGTPRKLTLGPYLLLSLAVARQAAREALLSAVHGRDPAAEKITARQEASAGRFTFGGIAAEYVQRHAKAHHRTWEETERLLTRADLAAWKDRDIRTVTRRDTLDLLDAVIERGSRVQANRLLTRMRPFFSWCVERGILEVSPIAGIRPPSPEISRDRMLSDAELAAVWRAADEAGFPFGLAIRLLILTGQRRSEVLEAEWPEFDIAGRAWTIPKDRSKTGVAHLVPLSEPAAGLVSALPRIGSPSRLLFTTNGLTPFSGVSKAFARLNQRAAQYLGTALLPWRPHDLRRTYASGCARLGVPVHVVEKALSHTSGTFGGIVGVYQRHDYAEERQHAMQAWAAHVMRLVDSQPTNVVPMRREG
jgi:integrase